MHGNQRAGDKQGADGNLDEQQSVAHGEATKEPGGDIIALDRLDDICVPDLPCWKEGEDDATANGEHDGDDIDAPVRCDEELAGEIARPPVTEDTKHQAGEECSNYTADE
jgi:hypothetical protein